MKPSSKTIGQLTPLIEESESILYALKVIDKLLGDPKLKQVYAKPIEDLLNFIAEREKK